MATAVPSGAVAWYTEPNAPRPSKRPSVYPVANASLAALPSSSHAPSRSTRMCFLSTQACRTTHNGEGGARRIYECICSKLNWPPEQRDHNHLLRSPDPHGSQLKPLCVRPPHRGLRSHKSNAWPQQHPVDALLCCAANNRCDRVAPRSDGPKLCNEYIY